MFSSVSFIAMFLFSIHKISKLANVITGGILVKSYIICNVGHYNRLPPILFEKPISLTRKLSGGGELRVPLGGVLHIARTLPSVSKNLCM